MENNGKTETSKQKYNNLKDEKSPYLLQHATNPVNWYPWGEEAFDKAKKEDKPIFLSIGYSTCHWCHVMAHESFEDPEVAKMMNETFINIKVDREERPEIDNIYMNVAQIITGRGGWPLTIVMDSEKRPFTAGTYFPKKSRFGQIGMLELIPRIKNYWENSREELLSSANEVIEQLRATNKTQGEDLTEQILDDTFDEAQVIFDEQFGGFNGAPKFPTPHKFLFLLRYWRKTKKSKALEMVKKTLREMRKGGIYDHIGFGFHRYSTDHKWLLPHFEKMLYDQALMTMAYLETYQATKEAEFLTTAEEILEYVMRDMTSSEGGFYSAEDADSEGEEGRFYTWTEKEIQDVLSPKESKLFLSIFNFHPEGNFYEQVSREKTSRNIPHLQKTITNSANYLGISTKELNEELEKIRKKLFKNRKQRIRPHKDDKILTDWNGLMITALAKAAKITGKEKYLQTAKKAANFLLERMIVSEKRLMHRFRDGEVAIQGMIDDYAFLIWGLLELYEASFHSYYLEKAIALNDSLIEHFWDQDKGGFYFTPDDGEELIVRKKEIYDGAIPSGNSVALLNLIRIARITADVKLEAKAMDMNKAFSRVVTQSPFAYSMFMIGLNYAFGPSYEVVLVANSLNENFMKMVQALRKEFIPNKVVLLVPLEEEDPKIRKITDFVKHKKAKDGKPTAHVCINRFCRFPTTKINEMLEQLQV